MTHSTVRDIPSRSLREKLIQGQIERREFLSRSLMAGLGLAGVGVAGRLGAEVEERPLTPTFYQWIEDLHPGLPRVNARFPGIEYRIAPVEAAGIERFVAEAKKGRSTWDVYVGQTPFAEMTAMIEAGVIEPWDAYIPQEVIDDIIPAIREECTVDGKLYSWPFLLDVIGMGWHSGITARAGISGPPPGSGSSTLKMPTPSSTPGRLPSGRPSTPTAGARWRRSPTA